MNPNLGIGTGPGSRGWELYITSVVMVLLSGLFVSLRLLQRKTKSKLDLDDFTSLSALVSSIALSTTEILAVKHGYGRRSDELTTGQFIKARQWFFGAQILYKIVLTLSKFSICCTYYRIFAISALFRRVFHLTQCIIIAIGLAFTLGTVFQCKPIAAFWDTRIEDRSCIAQKPWWMSFSIINILLDVLLLILPMPSTFKLQMSLLEKIGIYLIYCTGLFATATSIVRLTTLEVSAADPDPTWGPIPATTWSVIEANSAIIVGCLPALRQSFVYIFTRVFRALRSETAHSGASPGISTQSNSRLYTTIVQKELPHHWIELPESEGTRHSERLHSANMDTVECATHVTLSAGASSVNTDTSEVAIIKKTQEWEVTYVTK